MTQQEQEHNFVTFRPPPWKRGLAPLNNKGRDWGGLRRRTKERMWVGDRGWQRAGRKAGRQTVQVEVWVEDRHPGGGKHTESRVEMMEGEARMETGGARADQMEGGDRRDLEQEEPGGTLAGPRPQPRRQPTVEEWLPIQGGRPTAAEQVVEEPETETESQGNEEDPEEQMAPRLSDRGGAGGKEEPDRARGTRCSWRSGVPRWRMIDNRPRRSRRDEGARRSWWTDGPRRRGGSWESWWSCWVDRPRQSPGLRG